MAIVTAATVAAVAWHFSGESRVGPGRPAVAGATAAATPLAVPAQAEVLFIGDEWTAGAGALTPKSSWPHLTAKALGWDYRIDAVAGSGWAHDAPQAPGSRYVARIEALPPTSDFEPDVVVVSAQMASPATADEVGEQMNSAVDALRERLIDAVVVVVLPYGNRRGLEQCAPLVSDHVLCVDTFAEGWLTAPTSSDYFAPGRVLSNAGHAYFAQRLTDDLRRDLVIG